MADVRKDPSVRRKPRPSRHPSIVARRRLRRRIILALLAAALVSPLFLKFRTPRPAADAQAQLGTDGAGTTVNELGIAPFPTATLPVTRERLEERTDRP